MPIHKVAERFQLACGLPAQIPEHKGRPKSAPSGCSSAPLSLCPAATIPGADEEGSNRPWLAGRRQRSRGESSAKTATRCPGNPGSTQTALSNCTAAAPAAKAWRTWSTVCTPPQAINAHGRCGPPPGSAPRAWVQRPAAQTDRRARPADRRREPQHGAGERLAHDHAHGTGVDNHRRQLDNRGQWRLDPKGQFTVTHHRPHQVGRGARQHGTAAATRKR